MEPLPYQSVEALGASRAMRRYWRMIVGLVLICGIGGYFYAAQSPGSYSASATILVRALVGNAYSPETSTTQAATVALQTEAQLVASSQVTDLVRRNLPGTTCNQDLVTAKVLTNTQLIKISAKAASADTARRCAQEYATDYLARRRAGRGGRPNRSARGSHGPARGDREGLGDGDGGSQQPAPAAGRGGTGGGGERVAGRGPEPGWPAPGALDATREPRRGGERSADGK